MGEPVRKRRLAHLPIDVSQDFDALDNFKIRQADIKELQGVFAGPTLAALLGSIAVSGDRCRKVIDEDTGEILAVYGVAKSDIAVDVGHPWLLLSENGQGYMMQFGRKTKRELDAMAEGYTYLINIVGVWSTDAIRFIKWLGFTVNEDVVTNTDSGHQYYTFYMKRRR